MMNTFRQIAAISTTRTVDPETADLGIKKLQGKMDLPTNTYYQSVLVEGETVKEIVLE
ncbi:hypothetical protein P4H27_21245 [Paenibacillus taichungensis]|uniref:hypothetical protein n=1 Tax=Paenibacillus sp. ALJ109b TaxID=2709068 RepID=UPI00211E9260|nr:MULTISPECIES: hypothetical protein [unclassified Paenibacillus]MEC0109496.1 hypothetical protein [Paenibacillus taichungensis]MEC0197466.1 hypothetical protein [Paenibacillus taichungensis]